MTIDSNTWSGIALVIAALLTPIVTKYSSGGVAAKEDAEQAEGRAKAAEEALRLERASGQRWYQLFVQMYGHWSHERAGREMERTTISLFPGAPQIPWKPLDPLLPIDKIIRSSNASLDDASVEDRH